MTRPAAVLGMLTEIDVADGGTILSALDAAAKRYAETARQLREIGDDYNAEYWDGRRRDVADLYRRITGVDL